MVRVIGHARRRVATMIGVSRALTQCDVCEGRYLRDPREIARGMAPAKLGSVEVSMRGVVGVVAIFGVAVACGGTGDDILTQDGGDASSGSDVTQGQDGQGADTSVGDTGADGSDGAACPGYCSGLTTKNLFCSDFDGEVAPTDWTATVATGSGAVIVAAGKDVSCPNGLHASVPQAAASSAAGPIALVSKDVASGGGHVILDADVYLPSNDTKSYVGFLGVRPTAEQQTGAFVTHHGDAFWFVSSAGNGGMNIAINPAPLTGAWNHMTLDVHFGQGNAGSISLTYTGADNATHTTTGTGTTANASVTGVTVEAGMFVAGFTGSEAAFDAYYDNVVLKNGT
jgi:hypothetical protein